MMNQQLANQINAATSAKQAQLRAIQAGLANKNKTKPVSTVEPFQRTLQQQQQQQQQQLDNNHHVSAEDLKPGLSMLLPNELHPQQQQQQMDGSHNNNNNNNKNIDPKYQTLPYNTKFGQLNSHTNNNVNPAAANSSSSKAQKIEQLKQEKENNNVAFSEALPRPPPPLLYGPPRPGEFQNVVNGGGYGQGIGVVAPLPAPPHHHHHSDNNGQLAALSTSHLPPPASGGAAKPVSSVAPVFASSSSSSFSTGNNGGRYGTPQQQTLAMMTPPRLSSTPLSTTAVGGYNPAASHDLQRINQASPTKLRPALPPKPSMQQQQQNNNNSTQQQQPVHGEEGTSVDDVEDLPPPPPTTEPPSDSPTPEVDYLNGNTTSKDMSVSVPAAGGLENSTGGLMVAATTGSSGEGGGVHVSINR